MLRFDRKQQNSVKQLSFNNKNKLKKDERYMSSTFVLDACYLFIFFYYIDIQQLFLFLLV